MKTRKELIEEYKQTKPPMGVFQIKNEANGKIWLEGSTDMNAKWNRHRLQLNFGNHPNADLQSDWKTFGESQFTFSVIDAIIPKEGVNMDYAKEIKMLETMYVDEMHPFGEHGYNKKKV